MRMLKLIFGCTVFAVSTVLSAYMSGLALGSFVVGRKVDRGGHPLALYGWLEGGVGLSALLLPLLFRTATPLYVWIQQTYEPGFYVMGLIRFVVCFGMLLVPTTLMGGTLPTLSKYVISSRSTLGKRVGWLYGVNTLGAVLGAALAGFVLIAAIGQSGTLWLASGLSLVVGGTAWLVSRRAPIEPLLREEDALLPKTKPEVSASSRVLRFVLIAFGLSGFAALGYEVAWTRALVYFIGLDTDAFSAMLVVYLLGVASGSLIYARWLDREVHLLGRLGMLELGIGLSALGSVLVFGLLRHVNALWGPDMISDSWRHTPIKFLDTFLALFVPTLWMGATFPLAAKIYTHLHQRGGSVGRLYAVNTVGAILGAFLAGFLMIPLVGIQGTILGLAFLNLTVGLALLFRGGWRGLGLRWTVVVGSAVLWIGGLFWVRGRPMVTWSAYFHHPDKRFRIVYNEEGLDASIAVLEAQNGTLELNLNGLTTAYTSYSDLQVHQYLGHLPMLLAGATAPADVLVVGFGLGSTCRSFVLHDVRRVTCVELVKEERETASLFLEENGGVLDHPDFRLIIDDGRNYLQSTRDRFDVISINAIHPKFSPALYSKEFYEAARARLKPGGVMCAWITQVGLSEREFKTLIQTLCAVFPHVSLWDVNTFHFVLIGTMEPFQIDYASFFECSHRPAVQKHLQEVHLEDPLEFLTHFLMAEEDLRNYVGAAPIHSDNRPVLEFGTDRRDDTNRILKDLFRHRGSVWPYLVHLPDKPSVRKELKERFLRAWLAQHHAMIGRTITSDPNKARRRFRQAYDLWPENTAIHHLLRECYHYYVPDAQNPVSAWNNGKILERRGKAEEALAVFQEIVRQYPDFAPAYRSLALLYARRGAYAEALKAWQRGSTLDPPSVSERFGLALRLLDALKQDRRRSITVEWEGKNFTVDTDSYSFDLLVGSAYQEVGEAREADRWFRKMAEKRPSPQAYYALAAAEARIGHFAAARGAYEQVLELDPTQEEVRRARMNIGRFMREVLGPESCTEGERLESWH